jgi:hypothetical protein
MTSQANVDGLAQEQQGLLAALFGDADEGALWPCLQAGSHLALARRGLLAYQSNGLALAERALGAAYPVLAQLIGEESFAPLARQLWRQQPPQRGDLACWGAGVAAFIEAAPQLIDEPFLADVARVEWALHRAATAADAQPDLASLALLSDGDEANAATLTLGAGVFVLASAWPVVSIVNAHLAGQPTLEQAAARLQSGMGEQALVWRQGFKPRLRSIRAAEHALLAALQAGRSLDDALQQALEESPEFDFGSWLADSVGMGLVVGAHFLNNKQEEPL